MRILGEGQFVRLIEHDTYEYVERKGCTGIVSVVAITRDRELIFVEQYRPPLGCRTIELVAGLAGDEGEESLESAARRELLEEAGYEAGELVYLLDGPSAGGITTARVSYFMAPNVDKIAEGGGVEDEEIVVHVVPVDGAHVWLQARSGGPAMVDPKVYFGLAVALHGWDGYAP